MKKTLFISFGIMLNCQAFADDNSPIPKPQPETAPPIKLFIDAARDGQVEVLEKLLTEKIEANIKNTALMQAVINGHTNTVQLLIAAGADVNVDTTVLQNDSDGEKIILPPYLITAPVLEAQDARTSLMVAAQEGHVEVVKMLLAAGAAPHAKDSRGKTAYDYAKDDNIPMRQLRAMQKLSASPEILARQQKAVKNWNDIAILLEIVMKTSQENQP